MRRQYCKLWSFDIGKVFPTDFLHYLSNLSIWQHAFLFHNTMWPWPYFFWSQYNVTLIIFLLITLHCDPDHIASDKLITCSLESPWLLSIWGLDKGAPRKSTFIYFLDRGAGKFITLLNVISHGHKFRERKGTSFNWGFSVSMRKPKKEDNF